MIDIKLILNILIALFLYKVIFAALANSLMNAFLKSDTVQKERKSFRELVREKLEEEESQPKKS